MSGRLNAGRPANSDGASRPHPRHLLLWVAAVLAEALPLWSRGYHLGGNVIVRCREGHLFTTIWVPGISVKALRFAGWRLQRCPVGQHTSLVTLVRRRDLTESEERLAEEIKDVRLP
jgi:hypothetical protein